MIFTIVTRFLLLEEKDCTMKIQYHKEYAN